MPLTRLKDEYLEEDGVRFLMEDETGSTVACRVSHEALRDHANRLHLAGSDAEVFEVSRELIEQIASDAHDAEGPFDDHGRILVTFGPGSAKPEVLSAAAYGVFCRKTSFGNVIKTRSSRTAPEIGQPLGV